MRSTRSSRGVSEASIRVVVSRKFDWIAPQRSHLGDDLILEILVFALPGGRQRLVLELVLDVLVLQAAQPNQVEKSIAART